jgi:Methylase involved in ubiquinone/menaquinone biosynthesis
MVEVEERSSRIAYDAWHRLRPVDSDTDTPWHRLIKKYLRPADIDGKSILEIGCGRGGFSCWLAAHDPPPVQLAAADFSPAAVSIGREFADSVGFRSIHWNVADIQHLPYADSTFDTVISAETIEHVPDPRLAIAELARVSSLAATCCSPRPTT